MELVRRQTTFPLCSIGELLGGKAAAEILAIENGRTIIPAGKFLLQIGEIIRQQSFPISG